MIRTCCRGMSVVLLCGLVLAMLPLPPCHAQSAKDVDGSDNYWNATPNDVNNLLKSLQDLSDINYSMDLRFMNEVSPDPEKNPVLFRSGHYNFDYTPRERKRLREFLLGGGMIIYNTGLGSAPFYRSVIRELKEIFPERTRGLFM